MLLILPRELRDEIYYHLFFTTRLRFGPRIIPARHSLAILRTCHQVHEETKDIWISRVLFSFDGLGDIFLKFSSLNPSVLSHIKYASFSLTDSESSGFSKTVSVHEKYSRIFKLFPGLCLDNLTVFATRDCEPAYKALSGLILYGRGWKELHFVSPNARILGLAQRCCPRPLPSTWNEFLFQPPCANPDQNFEASITIFRSTVTREVGEPTGSVLNPATRKVFEMATQSRMLHINVCRRRMPPSFEEIVTGNEYLVVVKRGPDADIIRTYDEKQEFETTPSHFAPAPFIQCTSVYHKDVQDYLDWNVEDPVPDVYHRIYDFEWSDFRAPKASKST
ncbi:predicted protein [Uncinocarpus reesii 1704]|uniref:F-box domain-containing protein n=1 Tax=Uncinocarpus reesii (strain UAMH 1704) TaxID=336963 RepID=C4JL10_UNCRE|nr:uncharacterized protein UREG_00225 [Uncinocarpus reesii 1704]EEP75379.1 predicted protein [Uncinocarpus reesii 1704]